MSDCFLIRPSVGHKIHVGFPQINIEGAVKVSIEDDICDFLYDVFYYKGKTEASLDKKCKRRFCLQDRS